MKNKRHKLATKMISVTMGFLFIVLSIPFAFAVDPQSLNESNVVVWPTIEGEIFLGQKLSDGISLNNENVLVTSDGTETGTVIEGKFEFVDADYIPTSTGQKNASLKFVPTDEEAYAGFTIESSENVIYTVNELAPVLVDEKNDPPVATEVEASARLSTSKISGGAVKNPLTNEILTDAVWAWQSSRTKVTVSGMYPAYCVSSSLNYPLMMDIYVRIIGDAAETTIETNPTIETLTYDPNLKFEDVSIVGGKAVIKGTSTEVEGTFTIGEKWLTRTPWVGTYEVDVKFTPDDVTVALPVEFKCPVTVNKAVPKFKTDDESGVPTVTMPYGTKLNSSLDYVIKPLVDVDVPVYLAYKDLNGEDLSYSNTVPLVGTHEIQVRVNIDNSNYEQYTMLTFMLEITGFEANCIMQPVGSEGYKIIDTSFKYDAEKPKGTFTVSYTVAGEKQPDITVKYGSLFQVDETKSGIYEFSITYNQVENDPFEIADFTMSIEKKLSRNVNIGDSSKKYTYGDKVTAVAPATDPAKPDKPYYGFSGWNVKGNIGLSDEELKNTEISFYMPDEDVELNATYKFSIKLFFEWLWQQIVQFFTFIINAVKDLFALATTA